MKRLNELSNLVQANIVGNQNLEIGNATSISTAGPTDITFALTEKHLEQFLTSDAAAAVVPYSLKLDILTLDGKTILCCRDPEFAFREIVKVFRPVTKRSRIGISKMAYVCRTAKIADDVDVHPGAHVSSDVEIGPGSVVFPNVTILENCKIGSDVKIYPNSVLYENTIVGDRCIIHAGAILGASGFGYETKSGRHCLSAQLGNVVLENDVEVGANSTIDRSTYDSTLIGEGTKMDNLVIVAHNCQIGKHNLLCSQAGIAGSSSTGDYVVMGGQVGIGDHLHIGAKSVVLAQSGVMHNLEGGRAYAGSPALTARQNMQCHAMYIRSPETRKKFKDLNKKIDALESKINSSEAVLVPENHHNKQSKAA